MLNGLLVFLIGALVLAVVIYVAKLLLDMLDLPAQVRQIALIILGLIGLIVLLVLCVNAFQGGIVLIPSSGGVRL